MLVDGCNFAQLTLSVYRAMYFNCAALQVDETKTFKILSEPRPRRDVEASETLKLPRRWPRP